MRSELEICSDSRRVHPAVKNLILLILSCKVAGLQFSLCLTLLPVVFHYSLCGFEIVLGFGLQTPLQMKSVFWEEIQSYLF